MPRTFTDSFSYGVSFELKIVNFLGRKIFFLLTWPVTCVLDPPLASTGLTAITVASSQVSAPSLPKPCWRPDYKGAGKKLKAMTAPKSQGSETCVTRDRKLYERTIHVREHRKKDRLFKIKYVTLLCYRFLVIIYYYPVKSFIIWTGYIVYNHHIIMTMKIDSLQITSVRKAGLTIYETLWLGTQKSVRCPY